MSFLGKAGFVVVVVAAVGYIAGPDTGAGATSTVPSTAAGEIPADYVALYQGSGSTCPNLDWALLAAVGKIETNHGRTPLPGVTGGANSAGARGPMQFMPATFASVRERHPEVGSDVYDPAHAIPAAAHLLCDNGVRDGRIRDAVWGYNHADWYVDQVLAQATEYR